MEWLGGLLVEDNTDRIKRLYKEECALFTFTHQHCWHSVPGYDRWRCHCGLTADVTLMDYYAKNRFFGRNQSSALH